MNRERAINALSPTGLVGVFIAFVGDLDDRLTCLSVVEHAETGSACKSSAMHSSDASHAQALDGLLADVVRLIGLAHAQAARQHTDLGHRNLAEFAYLLAAWADENLLRRFADHISPSLAGRVEHQLFGSTQSGEEVFARMDRLLASSGKDVLALAPIYMLVLGLGFRGRHTAPDSCGVLRRYQDALSRLLMPQAPDVPECVPSGPEAQDNGPAEAKAFHRRAWRQACGIWGIAAVWCAVAMIVVRLQLDRDAALVDGPFNRADLARLDAETAAQGMAMAPTLGPWWQFLWQGPDPWLPYLSLTVLAVLGLLLPLRQLNGRQGRWRSQSFRRAAWRLSELAGSALPWRKGATSIPAMVRDGETGQTVAFRAMPCEGLMRPWKRERDLSHFVVLDARCGVIDESEAAFPGRPSDPRSAERASPYPPGRHPALGEKSDRNLAPVWWRRRSARILELPWGHWGDTAPSQLNAWLDGMRRSHAAWPLDGVVLILEARALWAPGDAQERAHARLAEAIRCLGLANGQPLSLDILVLDLDDLDGFESLQTLSEQQGRRAEWHWTPEQSAPWTNVRGAMERWTGVMQGDILRSIATAPPTVDFGAWNEGLRLLAELARVTRTLAQLLEMLGAAAVSERAMPSLRSIALYGWGSARKTPSILAAARLNESGSGTATWTEVFRPAPQTATTTGIRARAQAGWLFTVGVLALGAFFVMTWLPTP